MSEHIGDIAAIGVASVPIANRMSVVWWMHLAALHFQISGRQSAAPDFNSCPPTNDFVVAAAGAVGEEDSGGGWNRER